MPIYHYIYSQCNVNVHKNELIFAPCSMLGVNIGSTSQRSLYSGMNLILTTLAKPTE